MTQASPRPSRADLTKKRLLEAAESEFAAKGFDGARLGTIATAAGVQSALIHHYFVDKEGLYRAVVTRAIEQLSREGWSILENVPDVPRTREELAALVTAFVDSLLRFHSENVHVLALFQHEWRANGPRGGSEFARTLVQTSSKPMCDAVVTLLEEMKRRGVIRADVDPRQACISAIAMCAYPFYDAAFLDALWQIDVRDPAFLAARRQDVVLAIMARLAR